MQKIDPRTNQLLQNVSLPERKVTSCTFGGPNLDVLYMTTTVKLDGWPSPQGPTIAVTGLGVKGHPDVNANID